MRIYLSLKEEKCFLTKDTKTKIAKKDNFLAE